MKEIIINIFKQLGLSIGKFDERKHSERKLYFERKEIFKKYKDYTMIPEMSYIDNLEVANMAKSISGDVVECGVWRGGMIAGISEILKSKRKYWLFDSFEGLPPAEKIDGEVAIKWQNNTEGKYYYDNCKAEEDFANRAMSMALISNKELVKGWFKDTVFKSDIKEIALLRLDGDWYESTMVCLEAFYPKVGNGGIIIIDDYYFWDGCSKAVHDYFSKYSISDRIQQSPNGIAFIVKNKKNNEFVIQ